MLHVNEFAKICLEQNFNNSGIYVDFTMGNGNDTLWLSTQCSEGIVYAFDIQQMALEKTKELLLKNNITNAILIKDCHSNVKKHINTQIDGGIFNLGYLPSGDKLVKTNSQSTTVAVSEAVSMLKVKGALVIVLYVGHEGGQAEADSVEELVKGLDKESFAVCRYQPINKINPPYVICIERIR